MYDQAYADALKEIDSLRSQLTAAQERSEKWKRVADLFAEHSGDVVAIEAYDAVKETP